jgi:hypothetical protein
MVGFTLISFRIISFLNDSVVVVVAVLSILVLSWISSSVFTALVSITDTVFDAILLTYNLLVIGLIAIPTGESPPEVILSITLLVRVSITEILSES